MRGWWVGCAGLGTFVVAARMRGKWRKVRWGGGRGEKEELWGWLGGALLLSSRWTHVVEGGRPVLGILSQMYFHTLAPT